MPGPQVPLDAAAIAAKYGGTALADTPPTSPTVDAAALAAKYGGAPLGARLPPIMVDQGFTSDVKVTPAPTALQPPLTPSAGRLGSAKTGGMATALEGTMPVLDAPAAGVQQAATGVAALGRLLAHPAVVPADPHVTGASAPGTDVAMYNAGSDILEGAAKIGTPLALAGAIVALPETLGTLAASWVASHAAGKAADMGGASPEAQRFLANLAGTVTAVGGAKVVLDSLDVAATTAGKAGRAAILATKLRTPMVARAAEATAKAGIHAPIEVIDSGTPSTVQLPPGSGPPETLTDIIRTALAPEPPQLNLNEGVDRSLPTVDTALPTETLAAAVAAQHGGVLVDEGGRALGGYAGPERRRGDAGPPPGLEERRLPPAEQVRKDLRDNPELVREADAMKQRADESRETPAVADVAAAYGGVPVETPQPQEAPDGDAVRKQLDEGVSRAGAPALSDDADPARADVTDRAGDTRAEDLTTIGASADTRLFADYTEPHQLHTDAIKDRLAVVDAATAAGATLSPQDARYADRLRDEPGADLAPFRWEQAVDATEFRTAALTKKADAGTLTRAEAIERAILNERWVDIAAAKPSRPELVALYDGHDQGTPYDRYLQRRIRSVADELGIEPIDPIEPITRSASNSATLTGLDHAAETPAAQAGSLPGNDASERLRTEERGVQPSGLDPNRAPVRRRPSKAERVAARRAAEDAHLQDLVETARTAGYAGEPETLVAELRDRLALIKELNAERVHDGHDPDTLLRAIAKGGGISIERESALKGEIAWLKEFQDTQPSKAKRARGNLAPRPVVSGQVRGVRGVFRKDGLSLDGMLEYLSQDAAFSHITSINELLDEIRDAATAPPPHEAVTQLAQGLGERWWDRIGHPPAEAITEDEIDYDDDSFDVAELEGTDFVAQLEAMSTDEAMGVEFGGNEGSTFPDGSAAVNCTNCADQIIKTLGRGEVFGWDDGENPTSVVSHAVGTDDGEGHDFAIIDDRYLVDPWAKNVEGSAERAAYDLENPTDRAEVLRLYGDPTTWVRREEQQGGGYKWVPDIPGPLRTRVDTLDTGEAQPTLPGAEDARKAGKAETTFRAPVQASGEDFSLETPLTDAQKAADAKQGAGPSLFEEDGPKSRSPIAQATIVPGLGEFIDRDVTPGFKAAFKEVDEAQAGVRAVWAPASTSAQAGTMAAIMRSNLALSRARTARAQKAMRALEVAWDKQPRATQLAFAMAVDEGRVDELPAWQRNVARLLDEINTKKRTEANALGGKVGYIEHYFPREWVRPGKVREFILRALYGKRPLQGRAGFKKARSRDKETGEIFPFRALHQAGFEPVSYNPITAHLRKWLEMDKWIAARRILLEGKRFGVATFVPIGDEAPENTVRYPDSFGTVYGPPTVPVQEAYDVRLMAALHAFAESLGVKTVRKVKVGGTRWGYAVGDSKIVTKFAGPETVLEHEIGHILDERYGLRERWVKNPLMKKELRALADLRFEGSERAQVPDSFLRYVRKGPEKIANLVHAFIYNPALAKETAPNAYWALYNLAKETPALRPLLDLQKTKSLVLGAGSSEVSVGGLVIKGHYYGHPDAVRLMEHHLSPGLRGNALFNLYRRAGNLLNQVQLGLSAFHLVMTSIDQVVGKSGMVLEHLSRGQLGEAAKKALLVPVAPIADVIRGDRLLKQFYERDATFGTITDVADAVARGGGGVGWDAFWHESAPERFMQALRTVGAEAKAGNYPGAALRASVLPYRALTALIEVQAKPIMEWWVPRLKLAAYMDLYRMELADLGQVPDEIELRKVAGKAWDTVDNWLGELIYDNLFWHAVLKDAGMASIRALGWTLGTVRGVFGAVPGQLRQVGLMPGSSGGGGGFGKPPLRMRNTKMEPDPTGGPDIAVYESGRAPWLTHDFARLLSMLFWVATFGAIYQYLHTGLKPGEDEDGHIDPSVVFRDLYFPRTGGTKADGTPERASLPSYAKELYAFLKHPVVTASHKVHPMLGLTYDVVVQNEDYFGTEIANRDDPWMTQLRDVFSFIGDQYKPITVRTFEDRRARRGETGVGAVESFFGVGVAPATVTRSDAEEYLHSILPPMHLTKAEAAKAAARRDLRTAYQTRDAAAGAAAITAGNLSRRSILLTAKSARKDALQRSFERTTLPQAIKAYELATPEERAEIQPLLARKWHRLFAGVDPGEKTAVADRFKAAIKLPVTRRVPASAAAAAAR